MSRLTVSLIAVGLVCGACEQPAPRLNAPPHGTAERASQLRQEYDHMLDNALLADMSVTDVHFVPNRSMLNSLGEERLCRLASLMELYGGTVRLSTSETDEKLTAARLDTIKDYLCDAGIDLTDETVVTGQAASPGLDANHVLLYKSNAYTPSEEKQSGKADAGLMKPSSGNKQ